jgi:hypothetical protein
MLYVRHRIKFCHIANKVHIVCTDGTHAHDKLGGHVDYGKEYNREVVGHERGGGPVTLEENFPSTELGLSGVDGAGRGTGWASANAVLTHKNEKHPR